MTTSSDQYKLRTWVQENLPEIGLGGVAIGNEFEYTSDDVAEQTLAAAWQAGVRYYDVSPWYGLGLAERRYGRFLHNQKREDYIISSKVGKLLKASKNNNGAENFPYAYSPNNVEFDYSAEAVRRSIEDSLQRLGIDSLDIIFVHDLSPDNKFLKGNWLEHFAIAEKGAFPELTKMREEGLIKAWGLGVNTPEPILKTIEVADPDVFLLASQYSLIEHEYALNHVFPEVRKRNLSLVMGSNLNAGFLSGSDRYNYDPKKPIPPEFIAKKDKLQKIAAAHQVDLRTAALQFAIFPDVAAAVIPGARTPEQVTENVASMKVEIPDAFWQELKQQQIIAENAPVNKA
ncbi:MAG: aldo/keto reductase [Sphingobacteriaceae bacterium]|nr:MAG: aldo/keto reductase [Sphingobacteriaceae bacterium]